MALLAHAVQNREALRADGFKLGQRPLLVQCQAIGKESLGQAVSALAVQGAQQGIQVGDGPDVVDPVLVVLQAVAHVVDHGWGGLGQRGGDLAHQRGGHSRLALHVLRGEALRVGLHLGETH